MTGPALGLVLTAAVVHAAWNLLIKRAGGGVPFTWLFMVLSTVIYAPAAGLALARPGMMLGAPHLAAMAGTAVLHLAYFLCLDRGYRAGDLSLVYPLARGTGPLFAAAAGVALLGERPSTLGAGGIGCIAAGALLLLGHPQALWRSDARRAAGYALLTGATIGMYSIWDKVAVSAIGVPPLVQNWAITAGLAVALAGPALRRREEVRRAWRIHRGEALAVAVLAPLSYLLVLTALVFTPVSYVAPAREISVVVGAWLGARVLAEGHPVRRLAAAGLMAVGVIALALG